MGHLDSGPSPEQRLPWAGQRQLCAHRQGACSWPLASPQGPTAATETRGSFSPSYFKADKCDNKISAMTLAQTEGTGSHRPVSS